MPNSQEPPATTILLTGYESVEIYSSAKIMRFLFLVDCFLLTIARAIFFYCCNAMFELSIRHPFPNVISCLCSTTNVTQQKNYDVLLSTHKRKWPIKVFCHNSLQ
jgi:hypothetical protein